VILLISDFSKVLQPLLWSVLNKDGDPKLTSAIVENVILIMIVSCFLCNLAQAAFAPFVHFLLPDYIPAIPVFNILAFNLCLATCTLIPNIILNSAALQRQNLTATIWGGGLVLNGLLVYLTLTALKGDLSAVAVCTVFSQAF